MIEHHPVISPIFAILTLLAAIADIAAIQSLLRMSGQAKTSPLSPVDVWSQKWLGAWWTCRLAVWVIYAIGLVYTQNITGGSFGVFVAIFLAVKDGMRAWRA